MQHRREEKSLTTENKFTLVTFTFRGAQEGVFNGGCTSGHLSYSRWYNCCLVEPLTSCPVFTSHSELPQGGLTPAAIVKILGANPPVICMMESICTAQDLREITSHMKNINMFSYISARALFVKLLEKEETLRGLQALDPKQIKWCWNIFSKDDVEHRKT